MFSNRALWIVQVLLGVYFIGTGILHFVVPDGLPDQMAWMYELSDTLHLVSGTAEILGGLGLILPGATRIQPWLTAVAAGGLVLVMIGAAIWHITSGHGSFVSNIPFALLAGYVAYGRSQRTPFPGTFGAPAA